MQKTVPVASWPGGEELCALSPSILNYPKIVRKSSWCWKTFYFGNLQLFVRIWSEIFSLSARKIAASCPPRIFLRATATTAVAHLSHRNSVRPSVRPSVRHTSGSVKNGAR